MNKNIKYNVIKDFPKSGVRFIDLTPSLYDKESFQLIIDSMCRYISGLEGYFDYIVAPESRGFIWGSAVAQATGLPLVIVRKAGKLPPGTVGSQVIYETEYSEDRLEIPHIDLTDKKCIFIDDIYATGGTYQACKDLVKLQGGRMNFGLVVYDVGIQENDEVYNIFKGDEL